MVFRIKTQMRKARFKLHGKKKPTRKRETTIYRIAADFVHKLFGRLTQQFHDQVQLLYVFVSNQNGSSQKSKTENKIEQVLGSRSTSQISKLLTIMSIFNCEPSMHLMSARAIQNHLVNSCTLTFHPSTPLLPSHSTKFLINNAKFIYQ